LKFDISIMQESTKTKAFVGGAALMVVAALVSHFANQPRSADDFANVGEPFFENFNSSSQASSLEVVAVDPETVQRNRFKVAKVDGLWRIPSHEDYPAEASARLATTASSIIGIERESLAGRGTKDFKRLGVVDPLSEEIDDPEEVGQRITLKDDNDETLADYIVGKQVEDVALSATDRPFESGQNRQTYFYVRHAEEQQTYIVPLKLDLSTKFSDWIDPDLLRFETSDLSQITIRNYSLTEEIAGNPLIPQRALKKKDGDILALTKSDSNAWELAGVEEAIEEFDAAAVTEMIGVLDELQIEDVRQKLTLQGKQLLTPDLKVNEDPELMKNRGEFGRAISQLVAELEEKGFNLAGTQQQLELVSNQGEIEFGTNEGMRYTLYVGAPFEEGDAEIKVAGAVDSAEGDESDESKESSEDSDGGADDAAAESDGGTEDEEADDEDDTKSRYMLVRVAFDQSLLTDQPEKPTKPEEPQKPEGYTPPPAAEDGADAADVDADGKDKSSADAVEEGSGESSDEDKEAEEDGEAAEGKDSDKADSKGESDGSKEEPTRSPEFAAYDAAMEDYEQALVDYELALTRYKDDQEAFGERVETAKKLEAELNERFGDWYYVISGENLKALQVSRSDLVTKKKPPVAPGGQVPSALPDRPDISFDGVPDKVQVDPADDADAAAASSDANAETEMKPDSPEPSADVEQPETTPAAEPTPEPSGSPSTEPPVETPAEPVAEPAVPVENAGGEVVEPATDVPLADPVPSTPTAPPTPADGVPSVEPVGEPSP
jgi:hypothetical protein